MPSTLRSATMDPEALAKMIRDIVREEISTAFDTKLKPMQEELSKLNLILTACKSKVDELETSANTMEERMQSLEKSHKALLAENEELKEKTQALENHSRKYNLRIIGLQQGIEAGNPTAFVTKLLYELFGEEKLGPQPLVSIAHRTGPVVQNESRCMITRLHSFEVRRTIQRLVGAMGGKLNYRGRRIHIYPDMTTEQRKQQAQFNDIRALLRTANLRHGIAYPAKLLVTFREKTYAFTRAMDAMDFFEQQVKPSLNIPTV